MRKKDKKIEIQLSDAAGRVNETEFAGYQLMIGKKAVGQIAEIDEKFAVIKNGHVQDFHKTLERAVESVIETYNLNN